MAQQFYKDQSGEYRWRVISRNNSDVVGDSGEGYINRLDAARGLLALVESVDVDALREYIAKSSP